MTDKPVLTVQLASPRGFCAGVDRAIQIVEKALERYGAPVYVRHEIVHNRYVVEGLEARGVLPAGLWAMGKTKVYLKQAAQQRLESEHGQMARRRQERALRVALEARDLPTLRAAVAEAMRLRMGGALVRPRTRLGVPPPPRRPPLLPRRQAPLPAPLRPRRLPLLCSAA